MAPFVDAWWRAAAMCLHPRVLLLAMLPLLPVLAIVFFLGWTFWEGAVADVRSLFERSELLASAFAWLESVGAPGFRAVLAPMVVVALAVPSLVVATLLLVAWTAAPLVALLAARRRTPGLARSPHAAGGWANVAWSLACAGAALLALSFSVPLWLVPPLVLLLPPWIFGWASYRVLAFAVLSRHAAADERRALLRRHRWGLRSIGLGCGIAAMLPSLIWAGGAATLIFAPMLMLVAVALYTLVFVFASLWFAYFLLPELARMRAEAAP